MIKPLSLAICGALLAATGFSQLQTVDGEGTAQVTQLKKLTKKAPYGAYTIQKEVSFETGKGIDKQPIVVAREKGVEELTALQDNAIVGELLPYNTFVRLADYDFQIYYRNGFKSQKYPPEKVSLTDASIFLDDSYGMFYGFKAAEAGQRSRFSYEYEYTDAKYLTRFFFHHNMPVKEETITFKVPNWLQLDIQEKNFDGYTIKKSSKKEKDFTSYTYEANNLREIKREADALASTYYLPHLIITVRSYTIDQKNYNGFKSVADLYNWYHLLYKKAGNNPEAIKTQVSALTAGKSSDAEKIKSIYYWVQDNIKYLAFEEGYAGFVPQTVQEVYKKKYGDCKGMANLLTEMLKSAGYDAHFAWIGTRDIPYSHEDVQSMCVDNHAICVLYFNGKTYFLDGTEKYAPMGENAYRIQGKTVLVENGETHKLEKVPQAKPADNLMRTNATLSINDDNINGHVTISFTGEAKNYFHNLYNSIPANKRQEFIKHLVELNDDNVEATNIKSSDFKNRDIPITIEGDVEVTNQVTNVGKQSYLGIDFVPTTLSGYLPKDDRQTPMDLDRVMYAQDEIILQLPAGAKVSSTPPAIKETFKENNFEASYKTESNKLVLRKNFSINSPVIYNADFDAWKSFIGKIKEFNRNKITIDKQ